MKKSILFLLVAFFLFNNSYAQQYFGKTYAPTQNVDEYYDTADVEKPYTVMGTTELGEGLRTIKKVQEKIIKLAKAKGADGVVFKIAEEVISTSTSDIGTINNQDKSKKNTTISAGSVSTTNKQKKVYATFIKYK